MVKQVVCDRCGRSISESDDRITDLLTATYPGQDICSKCDIEIQLSSEVGRQAALKKKSPQQILSDWLQIYKE